MCITHTVCLSSNVLPINTYSLLCCGLKKVEEFSLVIQVQLPRVFKSGNMLPSWQQWLAAELTFGSQELTEPWASDAIPKNTAEMRLEKSITGCLNIRLFATSERVSGLLMP